MSDENAEQSTPYVEDEKDDLSLVPDTAFKVITKREAEEHNLQVGDSEIQFVGRGDLVVEVPPGVSVDGTLFDFFALVTLIEFKSENDPFDVEEFVKNQIRTGIQFLQAYAKAYDEREKQRLSLKANKEQEITDTKLAALDPVEFYGQYLNLYVLARYPTKFLDTARKDGIIFTPEPGRPWLLRAKIGFQNIALVICRDLPFERRYYEWLLFAPSGGKRWKTFIKRLEEEGEKKLLETASRLRPKEFTVTKATVDDIWEDMRVEGVLTPKVEARMAQETHEAIEGMLNMLEDIEPFVIGLFFDRMTDAQASRAVNSPSILTLATFLRHFEQHQYERALSLINDEERRRMVELLWNERPAKS